MRSREQPIAAVFSIVVLVLSALVGVIIPMAGGSRGSAANLSWTPPPTATPTLGATLAPTTAATPTATRAQPTATPAVLVSTTTPVPSATLLPTASPSAPPSTATPRAAAAATATATAPATATASAMPPKASIPTGPVNLRAGPGTAFGVLATAKLGDELELRGRSADGLWVQLCCVAGAPAWASAAFVTLPVQLDSLPIVR